MLIVDVNNVLHASSEAPAHAPDAVARLLEAVLASRYGSGEVVMVCDGSPGRMSPGAQAAVVRLLAGRSGCRVLYSGPEREADDVIEDLIRGAARPRRLVVVSSDRRVADAARRAGATALKSHEFDKQLTKDRVKVAARAAAAEDRLDALSVEWWMGYFGMDVPEGVRRREASVVRDKAGEERGQVRAENEATTKGPPGSTADWLADARRMWPGVSEVELNMEKILKQHDPPKKRERRKSR